MIAHATRSLLGLLTLIFSTLVFIALLIPDEHLNEAGTVMLVTMLFPANYFPLFYTIAFRWWGGHLGRALFIKALGLAIVLDTALMVKFLGGKEWADEIRFVAYSLVLIGMFYQSIVMTRIRLNAPDAPSVQTEVDDQPTDMKGVNRHHDRRDTL